jgi:bacillaene synthase trans-acting acyltransferase
MNMLEMSFSRVTELSQAAQCRSREHWLGLRKESAPQRFAPADELMPPVDGFERGKKGRLVLASKTVFMFSGQGSQYFQMGRGLYDSNETFRDWMVRLDEIAEDLCGTSVTKALYCDSHRRADPFERTLLTHPAIFMVEYALAQCLISAGIVPDVVLGASLGSFAAAAVAEFVDVEDALKAVIRQAIILEETCEPGGMMAVLADPMLFAEEYFKKHSELAAINSSSHFVLSARRPELADIEAKLKTCNITCQRLAVSLPFHSRWIEKAKGPFQSFMQSIPCKQGQIPLMCCQQAMPLSRLCDGYFWSVVRHPIQLRETIAQMEQQGTYRYIDVGPAGTLATSLKHGMPLGTMSTIHAILTPFGYDQRNLAVLLTSTQTKSKTYH